MKRIKKLIFLFITGIAIQSCTYDFIKEAEPVDPGTPVSFSQQILPIFNNSNNCTACHRPGLTSPDLTTANAYSSIQSNNLVNTATPASSIIYSFPEPGSSTHNWKKYSVAQAQLVLTWIQQGALNN